MFQVNLLHMFQWVLNEFTVQLVETTAACVGTSYFYFLSENISIIRKTCLQTFFDSYECVGLFMYPMVRWWLEAASGSAALLLMWIWTRQEDEAFAFVSPCWQNTRNLFYAATCSSSYNPSFSVDLARHLAC